jgi:hypothetical protein
MAEVLDEKELGRLVLRRTPFQHERVPFVVLWAHKAGCTSILKWFLWHAGLLEEALAYHNRRYGLPVQRYQNEVLKTQPDYNSRLIERIIAGTPIINFVRCPYSRAYSSYMHLQNRHFVKFEKDGIEHVDLNTRYQILRWIYGSEVTAEYPFSFLEYLQWLHGQNIAEVNPHHTPQWTPLYDTPGVSHFRLEEFAEATSRLEKRYAIKSSRQEKGLFSSGHHLRKGRIPEAATLELLKHGIPLAKSEKFIIPEVSRRLLQNTEFGHVIEAIFKKDISFYDAIE